MFLRSSSTENSGWFESSVRSCVIFASLNEVENALAVAANVIFFRFVDIVELNWLQGVAEEIKAEC